MGRERENKTRDLGKMLRGKRLMRSVTLVSTTCAAVLLLDGSGSSSYDQNKWRRGSPVASCLSPTPSAVNTADIKSRYAAYLPVIDTKGMPAVVVPPSQTAHPPLTTIGVGMRRKNVVLINLDVYLASVAVSDDAIEQAMQWEMTRRSGITKDFIPLSTFWLPTVGAHVHSHTPPHTLHKNQAHKVAHNNTNSFAAVALTLRMQRTITYQQFISALREQFSDLRPDDFKEFQRILEPCIGENLVKGDEMSFYWLNNGSCVVCKNGKVGGVIDIDSVVRRLMDVYIESKRSVVPELCESIEKNLNAINTNKRKELTL